MKKDYVGIGIRKIREKTNPYLSSARRRRLQHSDFTIISNNCWAGTVYRYYGLPYRSPTAGLYFFAADYLKFVSDLRKYVNSRLCFISASESRYADILMQRGESSKVIAQLDDIEVVFLHYSTPEKAAEKWIRRCKRINWDNIFIKFSEMNECTYEDLRIFDSLDFANKICFTSHYSPEIKCSVEYPYMISSDNQLLVDTDRFQHGFSVTDWLNNRPLSYPF